jgi:Sec-independent protein translocase protein TatA
MLFAWMDFGSVCFLWIFILFGLPAAIKGIGEWLEQREATKKAEAQERFQRENPELWRQQELLKLEKERLEAQKQLSEEQARQESARRNVGLIVGIGRGLGWW